MMILEILVILFLPLAVLKLSKKYEILGKIGAITICYAVGFIIALLPFKYDKSVSETVASVLVAIAIPLILSSFDIRDIKKLAKKTLISFILVIISVMLVSSCAAVIGVNLGMQEAPYLAGMATGLYIGGTPNLFAIGKAFFGQDSTVINLANIADSLFGGVYFLFVLIAIKTVYAKILGRNNVPNKLEEEKVNPKDFSIKKLILVFLFAVLSLGIGVVIEILINGNMDGSLFIMLSVSVLGIVLGLIKPVRETKGSFELGEYLILSFSLGLSMSIDFSKLVVGIIPCLIFFAGVQTVSIILHFILCKIFKIDGGTALITIIAGIYGPPFIAPTAESYGEDDLILPGVICGSFGLIVGNLLGLGLAGLLISLI